MFRRYFLQTIGALAFYPYFFKQSVKIKTNFVIYDRPLSPYRFIFITPEILEDIRFWLEEGGN